MSKRTQRRESERAARKLAFQQLHQSAPAAAPTPSPVSPDEIARMEAVVAQVNRLNQLRSETNRANAQHMMAKPSSTGRPETTVSQNRCSHGLTCAFQLLPTEDMLELKVLTESVYAEYQPETGTEHRLAASLIRHYWLMQRALTLQDDLVLSADKPSEADGKRLALFMRYQTTHERSYYKAQKELQNINKQKQKDQIGFESQNRRNEALEAKTRLDYARALVFEVDANCRQVMQAPIPGTHTIPFADIAKACGDAIAVLATQERQKAAAQ